MLCHPAPVVIQFHIVNGSIVVLKFYHSSILANVVMNKLTDFTNVIRILLNEVIVLQICLWTMPSPSAVTVGSGHLLTKG